MDFANVTIINHFLKKYFLKIKKVLTIFSISKKIFSKIDGLTSPFVYILFLNVNQV